MPVQGQLSSPELCTGEVSELVEGEREMLAVWIVSVLALFACVAYAKEEEFNVFSTLRKSNFSVNLSKWSYNNNSYYRP